MAPRLASRLRRARLAQGLSQGALGAKLKVSQTTICNWEVGKTAPDEQQIARLERILGRFNQSRRALDGDAPASGGKDNTPAGEARAFGDWLRAARVKAGLSVPELADESGVSTVAIYNLENGRSTNPRDATRHRLEKALKVQVPDDVQEEVAEEQAIEGLGPLTDFDPHDIEDRPACPGLYVFYDVSDRPIYVGKARNIKSRVANHQDKFWFKYPIVSHGAFVEIKDEALRHQVEQVLIKFLKSNAVINKQSVERD